MPASCTLIITAFFPIHIETKPIKTRRSRYGGIFLPLLLIKEHILVSHDILEAIIKFMFLLAKIVCQKKLLVHPLKKEL